ncbi:MAG TPA: VanZ family protein, partial [Ilumatobacteraceae bacterium]|nr:VanZ family protein [Ilumatobacteraceae bacterium]
IVNRIGDWLRYDVGIDWFGSGWIEFGANILMFVPLGFLLSLLFRRPWVGVVLAVVLSAVAEVAQIIIPSRQPTLRDILANTLGAALGAALAWLIVLRRGRAAARPPGATDAPPTGTTRAP